MNPLFSISFYLDPLPNTPFMFSKLTLAGGILITALGVAAFFLSKYLSSHKSVRKLISGYGLTIINRALILLFLLFSREVALPYLSMRLWLLLWGIFMVVTTVRFLIRLRRLARREVYIPLKEDPRSRYLPHKKKKK